MPEEVNPLQVIDDIYKYVLAIGKPGYLNDREKFLAATILQKLLDDVKHHEVEKIITFCELVYSDRNKPHIIAWSDQLSAMTRDNPIILK